ncbi:hypothetical protein BOO69_11525 [Sulfitobacter alexandrii]|uniref:Uncharacterized protein n=1 Tax=Sulfitobacter alexandrii TaxID=1917485 RepID=A0A1J0WIH3_9RHOB|nr:hypothetical protein BOO69_11525 [Sulfitobacter alexandrii]
MFSYIDLFLCHHRPPDHKWRADHRHDDPGQTEFRETVLRHFAKDSHAQQLERSRNREAEKPADDQGSRDRYQRPDCAGLVPVELIGEAEPRPHADFFPVQERVP